MVLVSDKLVCNSDCHLLKVCDGDVVFVWVRHGLKLATASELLKLRVILWQDYALIMPRTDVLHETVLATAE